MVDFLNSKFSQSQSETLEKPLAPSQKQGPAEAGKEERVLVQSSLRSNSFSSKIQSSLRSNSLSRSRSIIRRFGRAFSWLRGRNWRRIFIFSISVFLTTLILIYLFVIHPAMAAYTKAVEMKESVGHLQTALGQRDLVLMDESLRRLETEFSELRGLYRRLGYLRIVPLISGYYRDGGHFLEAGSSFLEGGKVLLESISPFSDVLGLAEGFGKHLTTEQYVAKLAGVLPQIAPQIDTVLGKLFLVKAELGQVDPSRYPENIRGVKLRFWLEESQKVFSELEPFLAEARSLVEILPRLLGTPKRTYLVLFQNDAELRATGGFITYYALITLEDGKIAASRFMGGALTHKNQPHEPPPEPIRRYLRMRIWHMQDSNLSPDFSFSAATFFRMWGKSKLSHIDGIIAITTGSAVKILELIGPIRLSGYDLDLSSTNLPSDCRTGGVSFTSINLICRLEYYVERYTQGGTERKKAILGKLSEAVIEKITSSSAEIWPQLLDFAFELLDQKNALLYSTNKEEQELIERLGYAGRIKEYDGDYLHISDSNFGGKKTDLYMRENVEQNLTELENGRWRKTVKIDYYNPQKYDNWLSANYKDFVRIYVPKGSELVKIEGASQEWGSWTELGKTVFGAYFTLWPQKKHTLTFVYDLPSSFAKAMEETKRYKLLVQKQPGTNITLVKVKIGGKIESFDLEADKEIEVALE